MRHVLNDTRTSIAFAETTPRFQKTEVPRSGSTRGRHGAGPELPRDGRPRWPPLSYLERLHSSALWYRRRENAASSGAGRSRRRHALAFCKSETPTLGSSPRATATSLRRSSCPELSLDGRLISFSDFVLNSFLQS